MKISTKNLVEILRQFQLATDQTSVRDIDQITSSNPDKTNQLTSFRYEGRRYYLLIDSSADDDPEFIVSQIQLQNSNANGDVLINPASDTRTFGLPYKGKDVYLFRQDDQKIRLDQLLANRYPKISRSSWQKHIKAGRVSVNGTIANTPSREISEQSDIAIDLPPELNSDDIDLKIIYIDDDTMVIDKPTGILTHAKGSLPDELTVADFLRKYTNVGLDGDRPGIVHRLDRDTSGILIAARTARSYDMLTKQFSNRTAHKTYIAVIDGIPKHPAMIIDLPIGRNPSRPSRFRVDPKGKPSQTELKLLATDGHKSLVELKPRTGRTHQLRVHLAYINCPIVGDRLYNSESNAARLFLHAKTLEITIPPDNHKTFTSPLPSIFAAEFPELIP